MKKVDINFFENIDLKNILITAVISAIVSYILKLLLDYILKIIFPILRSYFETSNLINLILFSGYFLMFFIILNPLIKNKIKINNNSVILSENESKKTIKSKSKSINLEQKDENISPKFKKTSNILNNFNNQINLDSNCLNGIVEDFLENFIIYIKDFKIYFKNENEIIIGEKIYESIESYTPLRNQYIKLLEKIMKINNEELDSDIFIKFFSNLHYYTSIIGAGSYHMYDFANFDFFLRETFLYTIAISLKYQNYNLIEDIFYSPYFFEEEYSQGNKEFISFVDLDNRGRFLIDTFLNPYYENKELNLLSPMADLITKRIPSNYKIDDIVDADILCCYISNLYPGKYNLEDWFPFTYVYKQTNYFDFIRKLTSKKHFDKVKRVFGVGTIEELKEIIKENDYKFSKIKYSRSLNHVKQIEYYVNLDMIGTLR